MLKKLGKKGHLMPVPVDFHLDDIFNLVLFTIPFIAIYLWHMWHDHRHNDKMIRRLDKVVALLERLNHKK